MSDLEYLTQLAKRCRRLARSCFDLGVAGELREIAAELEHKAPGLNIDRQLQEPGTPIIQRASQRPRRQD